MPPIQPIPLVKFRQHLARLYSAARRAPKTLQQLDHAVRLAEDAGARTTADLTTESILRVLEARAGGNTNTTRGLLARLRRAYRIAARERWVDRDLEPDWGALWPEAADPKPRYHTAAEVARLLAWLAERTADWSLHRLYALVALVAYTGLRRNEALYARVEELDLDRGWIFVTSSYRRLKRPSAARPVPLPDALVPILRAWLPHTGGEWLFPGARSARPWHGGAPGYRPTDRLCQAAHQVGIAHSGFHWLRHTLSTQFLEVGVPEWAIQRVLRHTTLMTTRRYLHPADDRVKDHVRGFRFDRAAADRPAA